MFGLELYADWDEGSATVDADDEDADDDEATSGDGGSPEISGIPSDLLPADPAKVSESPAFFAVDPFIEPGSESCLSPFPDVHCLLWLGADSVSAVGVLLTLGIRGIRPKVR